MQGQSIYSSNGFIADAPTRQLAEDYGFNALGIKTIDKDDKVSLNDDSKIPESTKLNCSLQIQIDCLTQTLYELRSWYF